MLKKYPFDPKKFRLGWRTVKSGIAVFLVVLTCWFWKRDGIQIAALAAVFSLREDFDQSVHFGLSRLLGNAIGGAYALSFFLLSDWVQNPFWVTLICLPIFTMLTIMTNVAMNNSSGVISGVATMLIIALSIPPGSSGVYALTRVLETFIGVFIAILVNADIKKIRSRSMS